MGCKRAILLVIVSCFLGLAGSGALLADAPVLEWVAPTAGPAGGSDYSYAATLDAMGNVFVVGNIVGASGNRDHTVVKYDLTGNEIWALLRNGPGNGDDYAAEVPQPFIDHAGHDSFHLLRRDRQS